MALAKALDLSARLPPGRIEPGDAQDRPEGEDLRRDFLLPFAVFGLDTAQMLTLLEKVPADWPLNHREVYYDFRLERWQKHIEPPTVAGILDEYADNSPSPEEGLAYLRKQWSEFLMRRGVEP
jgi:hypothetical protein